MLSGSGLPAWWGRFPLGVSFDRAKETKTRLGRSPLRTSPGYEAGPASVLRSALAPVGSHGWSGKSMDSAPFSVRRPLSFQGLTLVCGVPAAVRSPPGQKASLREGGGTASAGSEGLSSSDFSGKNQRPSRGRSAGPDFSPMRNRGKNRLGRSPLRTSPGYEAGPASVLRSALAPVGSHGWSGKSMDSAPFSVRRPLSFQGLTLVCGVPAAVRSPPGQKASLV